MEERVGERRPFNPAPESSWVPVLRLCRAAVGHPFPPLKILKKIPLTKLVTNRRLTNVWLKAKLSTLNFQVGPSRRAGPPATRSLRSGATSRSAKRSPSFLIPRLWGRREGELTVDHRTAKKFIFAMRPVRSAILGSGRGFFTFRNPNSEFPRPPSTGQAWSNQIKPN